MSIHSAWVWHKVRSVSSLLMLYTLAAAIQMNLVQQQAPNTCSDWLPGDRCLFLVNTDTCVDAARLVLCRYMVLHSSLNSHWQGKMLHGLSSMAVHSQYISDNTVLGLVGNVRLVDLLAGGFPKTKECTTTILTNYVRHTALHIQGHRSSGCWPKVMNSLWQASKHSFKTLAQVKGDIQAIQTILTQQ